MSIETETETETIIVPDLPAAELIALAQLSFEETGIPIIEFSVDLAGWDFLLNERGKTYQVLTRHFGRDWSTNEARIWQKSVSADGNVAAFIAWLIAKKFRGWFVSIPNDDARLWRHPVSGDLCAPHFYGDVDDCYFSLREVRDGWGFRNTLVAFRAM